MFGVMVLKAATIASRTSFSASLRRCSIRFFMYPYTKKSNTFRSGDRAGQMIGPPHLSIYLDNARLIFHVLDDKNEPVLRHAENTVAPVREGAHIREELATRPQ